MDKIESFIRILEKIILTENFPWILMGSLLRLFRNQVMNYNLRI